MKLILGNKGFTLVETLVAINLSFIGITFIISFYLFVFRFTQTISENYSDKYIYQNFFFNLEKTIKKSDTYKIEFTDDQIILATENLDTLIICRYSLSLNQILFIKGIENLKIHLYLFDGDEFSVEIENIINLPKDCTEINSQNIKSIKFEIKKDDKAFSYEIFTQAASVKRFANIIKE